MEDDLSIVKHMQENGLVYPVKETIEALIAFHKKGYERAKTDMTTLKVIPPATFQANYVYLQSRLEVYTENINLLTEMLNNTNKEN